MCSIQAKCCDQLNLASLLAYRSYADQREAAFKSTVKSLRTELESARKETQEQEKDITRLSHELGACAGDLAAAMSDLKASAEVDYKRHVKRCLSDAGLVSMLISEYFGLCGYVCLDGRKRARHSSDSAMT